MDQETGRAWNSGLPGKYKQPMACFSSFPASVTHPAPAARQGDQRQPTGQSSLLRAGLGGNRQGRAGSLLSRLNKDFSLRA